MRHYRGFSLLELIVSVAIIALLAGVSVSAFGRYRERGELKRAASELALLFDRARSETIASTDAAAYGVRVTAGEAHLFRAPYDPSTVSRTVSFGPAVTASAAFVPAGTDIVFVRLTGAASAYGTTTLSLVSDPLLTRDVTVFSTGIVAGQ